MSYSPKLVCTSLG